ncbi:hypothetical protein GCM10009430_43960 [Aquimarina litoralis]|uniref:HTTM-like domain-containing protein n=1 Tax=Aquimarina litoralis TaxID=584605 RepID=A0ABN1J804_9FLAO
MNLIKKILFKKISAKGLAVFRIAYALNFLFELIWVFNYRQLYFDKIPFLDTHFPDVTLLLLMWMVFVFLLCIGLYTRVATIINYVFTVVFISTMKDYEYHMIYAYIGINLLLIFLPIQKELSLDLLRKKIEYLNKGVLYKIEKVSKINYLVPVFVAVGLVYFDAAVVYKMKSPMWLNGLGIWLPSSLPQITMTDAQWLLNQEWLIKFLSNLTMIFEFVFIFLFWNKRFRYLLIVIGVGLHLGIFLIYPIPYFAIGYIILYLLLVPVSIWEKITKKLTNRPKKIVLYYDENVLDIHKIVVLIKFFDIFHSIKFIKKSTSKSLEIFNEENSKSIVFILDKNNYLPNDDALNKIVRLAPLSYVVIRIIRFFYGGNEAFSLLKNTKDIEITPFNESHVQTKIIRLRDYGLLFIVILYGFLQINLNLGFFKTNSTFSNSIKHFGYHYLGVTFHGVFSDAHFKGYNQVYSIKYKDKLLPILDEQGLLDSYMAGGTYAYWIWRVNRPYVSKTHYYLRKGLIEYSSFWAHKNEINLSDKQEFDIVKKKIKVSFKWERDLLHKNMEIPWEKVGVLTWEKKRPNIKWDE